MRYIPTLETEQDLSLSPHKTSAYSSTMILSGTQTISVSKTLPTIPVIADKSLLLPIDPHQNRPQNKDLPRPHGNHPIDITPISPTGPIPFDIINIKMT